jgi:hypothetical protein
MTTINGIVGQGCRQIGALVVAIYFHDGPVSFAGEYGLPGSSCDPRVDFARHLTEAEFAMSGQQYGDLNRSPVVIQMRSLVR